MKIAMQILLLVFVVAGVSACSCEKESGEGAGQDSTGPVSISLPGDDKEYLPLAILFDSSGEAVPVTFNLDGAIQRPRKLTDKDFPITAKIRTVKNITMVVYDGSCNIMTYDKKNGYQLVTIHDNAVCAFINP